MHGQRNRRKWWVKDGAVQWKSTVAWIHEMGKQAKPVGKWDRSYRGSHFLWSTSKLHENPPWRQTVQIRMIKRGKTSRKTKMNKRCLKMKDNHETWHLPSKWLCFFRLDCLLPHLSWFLTDGAGVGTAKPELPLDYWEFQQMMICLLMLLQVCLQEDECCDSLFKEVSIAWGREFVQQHRTEHRRSW